MITYFVSYSHPDGFGHSEITMDFGIQDFDDIKNIKKVIEEETGKSDVIIINYKKLYRLSESGKLRNLNHKRKGVKK